MISKNMYIYTHSNQPTPRAWVHEWQITVQFFSPAHENHLKKKKTDTMTNTPETCTRKSRIKSTHVTLAKNGGHSLSMKILVC